MLQIIRQTAQRHIAIDDVPPVPMDVHAIQEFLRFEEREGADADFGRNPFVESALSSNELVEQIGGVLSSGDENEVLFRVGILVPKVLTGF